MALSFDVIDTERWRKAMTELWPWNYDHRWIPLFNNPYGMVQYLGSEVFDRVLMFPVEARVDGEPAGWTCIYNVSDTHVRIRGVYVKPEFRGMGIAPQMLDYACSLWPEPWHTCIGYYRTDTLEHFKRVWGLEEMPGAGWREREVPGQQISDYNIILTRKRFRDANTV